MLARWLAVLLVAVVAAGPLAEARTTSAQAACTFTLGFQALHDVIPQIVGNCTTDEYHNAFNGDGLQITTGGLLVWRKCDNWTAFTNGSTTWINGPAGVVSRPNAGPLLPFESSTCPGTAQAAPAAPPATVSAPQPAAPVPEPEPITVSGRGSQVSSHFNLQQGLSIVRASQSGGRGNFIGHVLSSGGADIGLAVNLIGNGSSVRTIRVPADGEYLINVTADGSWSFTIEQPRPPEGAGLPQNFSGHGDGVTGFIRLPNALVTARAAQSGGRSNFIVHVVETDGRQSDLVANEVGNANASKAFAGKGRLVLLSIQADGDWSISLE